MSGELEVRNTGKTWTFTLQRAEKLNALNAALVDCLIQGVDEAHSAGARLLVFRGAGKSFCAGFDLGEFEHQSEGDLLLRFVRIELLLQAIANSPAQTLALAHGKVFGAGVDLFAACKQRIAAPDSIFRMPGLKFGLVLGTRRFGEIVGPEKAREILEDTSAFTAQQALAMNFARALAPQEDWGQAIEAAIAKSEALDDITRAELYRVLNRPQDEADLANLVRSAARQGIHNRLRQYLGK